MGIFSLDHAIVKQYASELLYSVAETDYAISRFVRAANRLPTSSKEIYVFSQCHWIFRLNATNPFPNKRYDWASSVLQNDDLCVAFGRLMTKDEAVATQKRFSSGPRIPTVNCKDPDDIPF